MKKLLILSVFLLSITPLIAQPSKVVNAYILMNNDDLLGAKQDIDAAAVHAKTSEQAKTWYYRGQIYEKMYWQLSNETASEDYGISKADAVLTAAESYEKALSLDISRIDGKDLKNHYFICGDLCFQEGVAYYNARMYDKAGAMFERCVDIKKDNGITDSLAIYNVALAWENGGDPDKSIAYYGTCVDIGYNAANCQYFMANLMHRSGLYEDAIAAANEGMERFPGQASYITIAINANLQLGRYDQALEAVNQAITEKPNDVHLHFTKGTLLESQDPAQAVASYQKALELDPDHRESLYNLGAHYFNLAVDEINADDAGEDAGKEHMRKALPYLQHLHDLVPSEPTVKQFLEQAKSVLEG